LFDEEDSELLHQIKWTKMQWIQDPNQSNVGNLNDAQYGPKVLGLMYLKTEDT
jgi:hypothetical protein